MIYFNAWLLVRYSSVIYVGLKKEDSHVNMQISVEDAVEKWRRMEYGILGNYVKIDGQRKARTGFPEVIYAEGKTPEQVQMIFNTMMENEDVVMATRVSPAMAEAIKMEVNVCYFVDPFALVRLIYFVL